MRVAIGSTVLQYGLANGHVDGIGTYTKALLQCYTKQYLNRYNDVGQSKYRPQYGHCSTSTV